MLKLEKCKKVFIDFDGVVVDSNRFKELAIERSVYKLLKRKESANKAIDYFNQNAGKSRKKKLLLFFEEKLVLKIMELYSRECEKFFQKALPTKGFKDFIVSIKNKKNNILLYILSGGEKQEIETFLLKNNLLEFFDDVLSSEKEKLDHLKEIKVSRDDIFIGDSQNDLHTAKNAGLNFILMEEFKSKESYPSEKLIKANVFLKTKNFVTLKEKMTNE